MTVETKKHDPLEEPREAPKFDLNDPELTRFDLVREGARRDGVEIVHYAPRFPVPGTRAEKRIERTIAFFFLLAGAAATAFVVIFVAWPWGYTDDSALTKYYTPLLGVTLGIALLAIGLAVILYAKKLLPEEVAVQDRHDGASPDDERAMTGATLVNMAVDEIGVHRRPLLKGAIALGLLPVAAVPVVALGGLINDPHDENMFEKTGFAPGENGEKIRLIRENETPIRPEEISVGGQITVFPGIPNGTTNEHADSPTLLIHLRETDAVESREANARVGHGDYMWGNYAAYSKICTHAGCPASLFEQQTNILLCPCHQSQFDITNNARPIFGPATRRLPMLPITVDKDGFLVAKSDYKEPVGPGFWERP